MHQHTCCWEIHVHLCLPRASRRWLFVDCPCSCVNKILGPFPRRTKKKKKEERKKGTLISTTICLNGHGVCHYESFIRFTVYHSSRVTFVFPWCNKIILNHPGTLPGLPPINQVCVRLRHPPTWALCLSQQRHLLDFYIFPPNSRFILLKKNTCCEDITKPLIIYTVGHGDGFKPRNVWETGKHISL